MKVVIALGEQLRGRARNETEWPKLEGTMGRAFDEDSILRWPRRDSIRVSGPRISDRSRNQERSTSSLGVNHSRSEDCGHTENNRTLHSKRWGRGLVIDPLKSTFYFIYNERIEIGAGIVICYVIYILLGLFGGSV